MTQQSLADIKRTLAAAKKMRETGKLFVFDPYPKQQEFFERGSVWRERMLRAGNQEGKTIAAAYETACHLTGLYPAWWAGRKFTVAPRGWVTGPSSVMVRDGPQEKLCGLPRGGEATFGTGMIPRELFSGKPSVSHGTADAYDTILVKHASGGVASASFKSYEQGRDKFQSESLDFIWMDEEPPEDIYSECLTRTTATNGILYLTFTPLKGFTALVRKFTREKPPGCGEIHMTIDDAKHITPEMKAQMIAAWPEHERDARARGLPFLGSNAVFEEVTAKMLTVPLRIYGDKTLHREIGEISTHHWTKLWALDFGIAHPFAAVLMAWDREYDVIYVLHEIKIKGGVPKIHAERIKAIAAGVPVAWPHDGTQRDKGSGDQLASIYRREGLLMLPQHATFPDGGFSTEAGIMEMLVRMRSERFKVAEGCTEWYEEFHSYYREKGLIVKKDDDLMSATRIGAMQIRSSKAVALGSRKPDLRGRQTTICKDVDFDPFTGV